MNVDEKMLKLSAVAVAREINHFDSSQIVVGEFTNESGERCQLQLIATKNAKEFKRTNPELFSVTQ